MIRSSPLRPRPGPRAAPLVARTLAALALAASLHARTAAQAPAAAPVSAERRAEAEWVELVRVVDGDTLHVRLGGRVEKLRLLSVDTEERLGKGHAASATKPQTVFGEECALWAEALFEGLRKDGEPVRVGLVRPRGEAERDVYGRLLCHVLLPDGTDYNLRLVREGRSPYFNKYGNDRLDHRAFAEAQAAAREAKVGIWDPRTNEARTPGARSAKRPYAELLSWWDARAAAVESFRERAAREPEAVVDAEDPDALGRAAAAGREVDVFGEVDRLFDEEDGSLTVLFRTSADDRALRARIPAGSRAAHEPFGWRSLTREFRQNFVWVRGRVERGRRGFELRSEGVERWRRAGPEPSLPAPARAAAPR